MLLVIVFIWEKISFSFRYKMKFFEKKYHLLVWYSDVLVFYLKIARNYFYFLKTIGKHSKLYRFFQISFQSLRHIFWKHMFIDLSRFPLRFRRYNSIFVRRVMNRWKFRCGRLKALKVLDYRKTYLTIRNHVTVVHASVTSIECGRHVGNYKWRSGSNNSIFVFFLSLVLLFTI